MCQSLYLVYFKNQQEQQQQKQKINNKNTATDYDTSAINTQTCQDMYNAKECIAGKSIDAIK